MDVDPSSQFSAMCSFPPVRLTSHFSNKATSFLLCHVPAPLKVSKKISSLVLFSSSTRFFFFQIAKAKKMERQHKLNSWIFIPFFKILCFSFRAANPLLVGALRSREKKNTFDNYSALLMIRELRVLRRLVQDVAVQEVHRLR